ncbi:nucleoside phosphatase family-domain-containing protein [Hygrophoropsis aurantiaca]|uniref:Nucleoside phosphatase family-domain-containing protein n=1 Tax=Hygrophoropsis aurantiaca TaxID=72124 RepID=A0ACB8AKE1_9AGAM|nr:nucleoside phosphatase family-domain-containing protein [Hygrophoropsis aurantiaca]
MPPPTSADSWLAARRFGIVIDAGSSGSRLQIYSWKDPSAVLREHGEAVRFTLPKVEKGVMEGDGWITKVEPGLSSFADNPDGVAEYLAPLLEHARTQIPPSMESETPLFLLATAGMRLLTPKQQAGILNATCKYLKSSSNFRIEDPSKDEPCGPSVRIITGEEEGLFGWIAVNYLMDGFTGAKDDKTTFGFLDMGGASTQIAFEPGEIPDSDSYNLVDVRLRLLGGQEIKHRVFVTTWLGYGTNQARERYIASAVEGYERNRSDIEPGGASGAHSIPDPCLPKDLELIEYSAHIEGATSHSSIQHKLVGTGSFTQCLRETSPLLNKNAPCSKAPCLFDGVHVPPINFSASHFIGVSEYWYSSEHVFGLGGPYDFVQYERSATEFCARDWAGVVKQHEKSRKQGTLGGDGEIFQNGTVVETGVWGDHVELSRLQMQCFKAAWIANVLHEGIGIPRVVDPGGNATTSGDQVAKHAAAKGLGRPLFQSVDTVRDIAISWTLGKMVLEASKEVKPLSKTDRPLVDPVDDIPASTPNPPIKPIRPPIWDLNALEDKVTQHLPPSLSREALGFSLVAVLFYATVLSVFICVAFRLRRQWKLNCRRLRRGVFKRDYDLAAESYSMEEGGLSRPPSPGTSSFLPPSLLRPLRRFMGSSSSARQRVPPLATSIQKPTLKRAHTSPSPTHAPPQYQTAYNDFVPHGTATSTATSSQFISRSSSPNPGVLPLDDGMAALSNSISSLSSMTTRSRNSSQMNLSTLTPRQNSLSRGTTTLQIPNGSSYHHDE